MDEQQAVMTQKHDQLIWDDITMQINAAVEATNQAKFQKHVCTYCAKPFRQLHGLKQHMRTHTGETPFKCDTCGKAFSTRRSLKEHELDHTGTRPYLCAICGKQFKRSHELKSHKRVHTGERPFSCETCGKTFGHATVLLRHSRIHSDERPHVCGACNQSFRQTSALKRHIESHNDTHPYTCVGCNECFKQLRHSELHKCPTADHPHVVLAPRSSRTLFKCSLCLKQYKSRVGLVYHIKTQHSNAGMSVGVASVYTCDVCSKELHSAGGLAIHKRTHNNERPYACGTCGDRFSDNAHLRRHEKRHTGERIMCTICDRGFISRWQVRRHLSCVHRLQANEIEDAMAKCNRRVLNVDETEIGRDRTRCSQTVSPQETAGVNGKVTVTLGVDCVQTAICKAGGEQLTSHLCSAALNANSSSDFPCDSRMRDDSTGDINLNLLEGDSMEGFGTKLNELQSYYTVDDGETDIAWLTSVDATSEQCSYEICSDFDALIAANVSDAAENVDAKLGDNHIIMSVNGRMVLLDMTEAENWLEDDLLENAFTKGV